MLTPLPRGGGGGRGGGGEERGSNLAADLRNLLSNPSLSDVVLVSKDGDHIPACRVLLAARSPVFERMLMNGITLESKSSEIPLPSIRTCALHPALEFLYTDSLSAHPLSFHNVFDVLHTSRYLLLPSLEHLALSFVSEHTQSLDEPSLNPATLLSRALEVLSSSSDTYIFSHLVDAITRSPLALDNAAGWSSNALRFYLKQTRNSIIRIWAFEYLRLRCVLMYCAHSVSSVAEEALQEYLPAQQSEVLSSSYNGGQSAALLESLKPYQSSLYACFQPWLHYLDIFQVHPQLLARVIEPMGIIKPSHLLHVFGFQAMFAKDTTLLQWKEGFTSSSFEIHEDGYVLEWSSSGYATTKLPVTSSMGIFEWDVVVENVCPPFLGIGICSVPAHTSAISRPKWLGCTSFGWALGCNGDLFHSAPKLTDGKAGYAPPFCVGSRIRVRLDMIECTCSFTVDGIDCGVAWRNIPSKVYPAVTMLSPGRVRLEVARDEERANLTELLQSSAKHACHLSICNDEAETQNMMELDCQTRTGVGSDVATDLGKLLNDPSFSDLVLVTKDEDRIWACRILLAARSCAFEGMLLNGVFLEGKTTKISLPSIRTCALFPTLEYIYTGTLSRYNLTLDNVLDIIHSARYLLLTHLENLALSFFFDQACSFHESSYDFVKYLSRAAELLSFESDAEIFSLLMKAIRNSPQSLDSVAQFSSDGLLFFLKQTQNPVIGISPFEYTRLRCVLRWCAHSQSSLIEDALGEILRPQQAEFLSTNFTLWRAQKPAFLESLKLYQGALKECLRPWLQHLDLFRVHPEILMKVIEPMGFIHAPYLLQCVRLQAMFSEHMIRLQWEDGACPLHFAVQEEGYVLENTCSYNKYGFGITKLPITSSTGICEWDVVVEETCLSLGIGFCSTQAVVHTSLDYEWLGNRSFGWVLSCTGSLRHNGKCRKLYAPKFGKGDRVRVHIDWASHTCSFTVNAKSCGVAWENIPPDVYPSVTMLPPGRVRLEVAGGEEDIGKLRESFQL